MLDRLKSLKGRQGAKSLIAIAVALALGWIPLQRLLATTSAEATVNARLINLRAPIDGKVTLIAPTLAVGTEVEPSETLLYLANPRADRGRLDDLRRTINGLTSDMHAAEQRVAQLKGIEANLLAQRNAFQEGRIRQLEARAAELNVQITTAEAMHADAHEAMERSKKLRQTGSQTIATLLHAERDFKTTQLSIEAARIRLEGNKIELDAAKKGLFVGDSYNDLPRSAQRLDEVRQQILDGSARIEENKGRLGYLEKELAAETEQFATHSHADVNATVRGRIWEVLTANGEEVRVGQDLLRVLDCAGAVVTATVSEGVYNKLWIGQQAHFRLRGERHRVPGHGRRSHRPRGRRFQSRHRADGADARALSRDHRGPRSRRAPRVQRRPHRTGEFDTPPPRSTRIRQDGRRGQAEPHQMILASGISNWDAMRPGLVMGLIAIGVLPWLDRNNTLARTLAVGVCLFLGWRYMFWRITETLPPLSEPLDFAVGVDLHACRDAVDARHDVGAHSS